MIMFISRFGNEVSYEDEKDNRGVDWGRGVIVPSSSRNVQNKLLRYRKTALEQKL